MAETKSKNRAVFIFLLILFVIAGVWIGLQLIKSNEASRSFTTTVGPAAVKCVGYLYTLSDIKYDNYSLSFTAANERISDYDITEFVISSNERRNVEAFLPIGAARALAVNDISIGTNFTIFVPGCEVYAKTCVLETGACS